MKKLVVFSLVALSMIFAVNIFSQKMKLKDFFSSDKVKDYSAKVKENTIYKDSTKFIVHNFEISSNGQVIEKGNIYRQFYKNGLYEAFYILGDKKLVNVAYWNDPTALVTANANKLEYCVESNINAVLFPMVIRGYSKMIKSGAVKKQFKNTEFEIEKIKTYKENNIEFTTYKVSTKPNVVSGTITCADKILVVKGEVTVDNDNAKRSGLKGLFAFTDAPKAVKYTLKFDYSYFNIARPQKFSEIGLDEIMSKYKKIECD